ncbi:c-type cytochrome [Desulfospira joergensenii]|uniref:c-type cytochrome n=1 Tax=Desulfospira joergensenii TaxID=53329 RepID=UPI0003B7AC1E|nr:cytochrome c [Desulfospira joergensenii]
MRQVFIALIFLFSMIDSASAHSWMAPESEANRKNPNPASEESIKKGQDLFTLNCRDCHGLSAKGLSKNETGLSKDTPDLPKRLKTHSDGDFHWKIIHGKGDMPSFKDEIPEREIWDIVNYINSLK